MIQIHPVQLQYSHTIGRAEFSGPGFRAIVGIARGAGDRLYVLNRSYEGRPDGKRITICTVGEEYITEFGRGVSAERADVAVALDVERTHGLDALALLGRRIRRDGAVLVRRLPRMRRLGRTHDRVALIDPHAARHVHDPEQCVGHVAAVDE